jgi:hypothetical protein
MNLISCQWAFQIKKWVDGSFKRYKAKRYHQQERVDFSETFSHVIKPIMVHLILLITILSNWAIRQLNVKNSFLHGFIDEDIYMV